MKIAKTINPDWEEYDQVVAANQLDNYGVIFLDEYDCPIDNEYVLEDLYNEYKENQK